MEVKVFGPIKTDIIAFVESPWTGVGSRSVEHHFSDAKSVSDSEDPNIARFSKGFRVGADPAVEVAAGAATKRLAGLISYITDG